MSACACALVSWHAVNGFGGRSVAMATRPMSLQLTRRRRHRSRCRALHLVSPAQCPPSARVLGCLRQRRGGVRRLKKRGHAALLGKGITWIGSWRWITVRHSNEARATVQDWFVPNTRVRVLRFLACDAFVMMFVRLSVWLSVWDGRALWSYGAR